LSPEQRQQHALFIQQQQFLIQQRSLQNQNSAVRESDLNSNHALLQMHMHMRGNLLQGGGTNGIMGISGSIVPPNITIPGYFPGYQGYATGMAQMQGGTEMGYGGRMDFQQGYHSPRYGGNNMSPRNAHHSSQNLRLHPREQPNQQQGEDVSNATTGENSDRSEAGNDIPRSAGNKDAVQHSPNQRYNYNYQYHDRWQGQVGQGQGRGRGGGRHSNRQYQQHGLQTQAVSSSTGKGESTYSNLTNATSTAESLAVSDMTISGESEGEAGALAGEDGWDEAAAQGREQEQEGSGSPTNASRGNRGHYSPGVRRSGRGGGRGGGGGHYNNHVYNNQYYGTNQNHYAMGAIGNSVGGTMGNMMSNGQFDQYYSPTEEFPRSSRIPPAHAAAASMMFGAAGHMQEGFTDPHHQQLYHSNFMNQYYQPHFSQHQQHQTNPNSYQGGRGGGYMGRGKFNRQNNYRQFSPSQHAPLSQEQGQEQHQDNSQETPIEKAGQEVQAE